MTETARTPRSRRHRISAEDPRTALATRELVLDRVRFGEPLRTVTALRRLMRREKRPS